MSGSANSQISMSPMSPSGFQTAAAWLILSAWAEAPTLFAAHSKEFTAWISSYWLNPPPCSQFEVLALPAFTSSR